MPARGLFHFEVRRSLEQDGWIVTHDPYRVNWGGKDTYIDLGAERLLAAERGDERIAVEVKSFVGRSEMEDLEQAVGQYRLYLSILRQEDPDRALYLAVPASVLTEVFREPIGQLLIQDYGIRVFGFNPHEEVITEWIP